MLFVTLRSKRQMIFSNKSNYKFIYFDFIDHWIKKINIVLKKFNSKDLLTIEMHYQAV